MNRLPLNEDILKAYNESISTTEIMLNQQEMGPIIYPNDDGFSVASSVTNSEICGNSELSSVVDVFAVEDGALLDFKPKIPSRRQSLTNSSTHTAADITQDSDDDILAMPMPVLKEEISGGSREEDDCGGKDCPPKIPGRKSDGYTSINVNISVLPTQAKYFHTSTIVNDIAHPPKLPCRQQSIASSLEQDEEENKNSDSQNTLKEDSPPLQPGRKSSNTALAMNFAALQTQAAFDESNNNNIDQVHQVDNIPRFPLRRRLSYRRSEDINEYATIFYDIIKKHIRTRTYHLRKYKNVFVGSEAVSALLEAGVVTTRQEAVDMGRELARQGLFHQ